MNLINKNHSNEYFRPKPIDGVRFKIMFPNYEVFQYLLGDYTSNANPVLYNLLLKTLGNNIFNCNSFDNILGKFSYYYENAFAKWNLAEQFKNMQIEDLMDEISHTQETMHDVKEFNAESTVESFMKYLAAVKLGDGKTRKNYMDAITLINTQYKTSETLFINEMKPAFIVSNDWSRDFGEI